MKVGIVLPITEGSMDGAAARWADLAEMTRAAEDVGFDSVWVEDHLIFRFEGRPEAAPWESFSMLTGLAAITSRVELGTLVTCTSFRNPALTAKIADTIDEISGGRLILGLGAGWHEPEYVAFGYPFDHRVSRFEEAIKIIHDLLHDGAIDFDGTYYTARDCELRPRGPRPNGPPILVGTTSPRMLRLTATYADAWNGFADSASDVPAKRMLVDAACRDVGREPASLERTVSIEACVPGGLPKPDQESVPLHGTAEELAAAIDAFATEGVAHLQIGLEPNTRASIEAFAPVLERLTTRG